MDLRRRSKSGLGKRRHPATNNAIRSAGRGETVCHVAKRAFSTLAAPREDVRGTYRAGEWQRNTEASAGPHTYSVM